MRTIVASTLVISMLTVSVLTALPDKSSAVAKIKIQPPKKHSSAYIKGYLMGCNDGQDQENSVATSLHSKAFIKGYNYAFSHGC